MNFSSLTPSELFLLADPNHQFPFLVKENALTGSDVDLQELEKEVTDFGTKRTELFQVTKVGRNETLSVDPTIRGDLRCWLTPKLCEEEKLSNTLRLVKGLIKLCASLKYQLSLNGDYSIQLTKYPGNGSRYVKHRDTFFDHANPQSYRKLTAIYYLNSQYEGGNLRVFLPNPVAEKVFGSSSIDIEPKLNTLVLFRSEFIEHEVLPCFKDRFAITVWASSSSPFDIPPIPTSPKNYKFQPFLSDNSLKFPLPIAESSSVTSTQKTIFVSIANYCDSEGPRTLIDLFQKARHPLRIFVGYVYQGNYDDEGNITDNFLRDHEGLLRTQNVRRLFLPRREATGPCFARHLAGTLWRQEDYYLQIDSHMRFRPRWDEYLIQLLEQIKHREQIEKPILTTYPLAYHLPNEIPNDIHPTVLVPWKFDENGLLRQKSVGMDVNSIYSETIPYFRSPLWAAGFSFSDARVLAEVPYSCYLPYLFFGEEMIMALRLFTHDYHFYAPGEAVLYHLYSRAHRPTINQTIGSEELTSKEQSITVVKAFLCDEFNNLGDGQSLISLNRLYYGLGICHSLQEFSGALGVNFTDCSISSDLDILKYILPTGFNDTVRIAGDTIIEDEGLRQFQEKLVNLATNLSTHEIKSSSAVTNDKALANILRFLDR